MKLLSKSEWLELDSPLAEPEVKWNSKEKYPIERVVKENGDIVWFGHAVNWKKEKGGVWTVLGTNYDAKPLERYLPEIVYGTDRIIWIPCEEPIYETMYNKLEE